LKNWSLNLLELSGPVQTCNGISLRRVENRDISSVEVLHCKLSVTSVKEIHLRILIWPGLVACRKYSKIPIIRLCEDHLKGHEIWETL
jgi:hypothetical protein